MGWGTTAPSGVTWSTEVTSAANTENNYNRFRVTAAVARGENNTIYIRAKIQLYGITYGQDGNTKIRAEVKVGSADWEKSSTYELKGEYGGWLTKKTIYYTGTAAPGTTILVRTAWSTSHYSGQASFTAPAYTTTYAITYNGNGATSGSTAAQSKLYDTAINLQSNGFTRSGYNFSHWNTKADGTGTTYAAGASYTGNAALTLYAIWTGAASTILSVNTTVQTTGNINLQMSRKSTAYYHKATFKLGNTTLQTSGAFAETLSVTVPRTWFNDSPTVTSISVTVSVQTYTNSACTTAVGSPATATITVTADAGMKPTVASGWATAAPYNTGAVSGKTGYIKGYSKATITFDASKITHAAGASLQSYSITCQGTTISASPYRTPVLTSTSVTVTCTVKDTRGRTASATLTLSVMDYAPPTISAVTVRRSTSNGTADDDGTYISTKATLGCTSLNGQNSVSGTVAFSVSGGSYGQEFALTSGTTLIKGTFSPDNTVTARITATDGLGNTIRTEITLASRAWAMKFRANGSGVAFGKAAENDNELQIPADWYIRIGAKRQVRDPIGDQSSISAPASDTAILQLEPGIYQFNLSSASPYLPCQYGVLELYAAGAYGLARITAMNNASALVWERGFRSKANTDAPGTWYPNETTWKPMTPAAAGLSNVGDTSLISDAAVTSVSSGTSAQVGSAIVFPVGIWQINIMVQFAANATGLRRIFLSKDKSSSFFGVSGEDNRNAVNSSSIATICKLNLAWNFTEQTTLYTMGLQTSGVTLNAWQRVRCVRIK